MILTFEVIATFGVSAVISFTISSAIMLLVAAKRGLICVARPNAGRTGANLNSTALLPPNSKAVLTGEQTPLQS